MKAYSAAAAPALPGNRALSKLIGLENLLASFGISTQLSPFSYYKFWGNRFYFRGFDRPCHPVGLHVLKMIGYVETLGRLGFPQGQELATDLVLLSLPSSYS
ncbi:hypothetical protein CRG98_044577 [Punica granatum]|uniref:Uncharacterized protein n=1 Tax=Punica granatum TaxID=22663 RepID=A0A2I0HTI7_PUNGR|nr:hypothetical protein CRG98_044577 [Punica granatum]